MTAEYVAEVKKSLRLCLDVCGVLEGEDLKKAQKAAKTIASHLADAVAAMAKEVGSGKANS